MKKRKTDIYIIYLERWLESREQLIYDDLEEYKQANKVIQGLIEKDKNDELESNLDEAIFEALNEKDLIGLEAQRYEEYDI